jgi:hypothetical protein
MYLTRSFQLYEMFAKMHPSLEEDCYEYSEITITKLNHRINDIEDENYREKLRLKNVYDESNDTFNDVRCLSSSYLNGSSFRCFTFVIAWSHLLVSFPCLLYIVIKTAIQETRFYISSTAPCFVD